jgi:NAD(P)-dependent dehydrogenase (short-subunit alcohol dehydrogenase family)
VKGRAIAEEIGHMPGAPNLTVVELDLTDRASLERFVDQRRGPLHILINNAGVVTSSLELTADGWELQFATNHLGHFVLTTGLYDALLDGAADRGEARVVALSSGAHMRSPVVFDDSQFEHRAYDPQLAYAQSKTANVLFAVELTRRWSPDGIFANAVNPGGVRSGLQRNFSVQQRVSLDAAEAAGVFRYKTPEQGAATTLVAAITPEFACIGGRYLMTGKKRRPSPTIAISPTIHTPSRPGLWTVLRLNNYGKCPNGCLRNKTAPGHPVLHLSAPHEVQYRCARTKKPAGTMSSFQRNETGTGRRLPAV